MDAEYFARIWEDDGNACRQEKKCWNDRAGEWAAQLADDSSGKLERNMARVRETAEHLRSRGALGPGMRVVDIGCGPGLFVSEFAADCESALGVDISDAMLGLGAERAKKLGRNNADFMLMDFSQADVEALGWEKSFDLVFMSNTPALDGRGALEKVMKMSRAYCCTVSYVYRSSELFRRVMRDLYPEEEPKYVIDEKFLSLFNYLWLKGYYPEMTYYTELSTSEAWVTPSYGEWVDRFLPRSGERREDDKVHIYEYLKGISKDEPLNVTMETLYGRILWDVRMGR